LAQHDGGILHLIGWNFDASKSFVLIIFTTSFSLNLRFGFGVTIIGCVSGGRFIFTLFGRVDDDFVVNANSIGGIELVVVVVLVFVVVVVVVVVDVVGAFGSGSVGLNGLTSQLSGNGRFESKPDGGKASCAS